MKSLPRFLQRLLYALSIGALIAPLSLGRAMAREVPFASGAPISNAAPGARSISVADTDQDGDLDVFAASYNDNTIAWYKNTSNGTVWIKSTIATTAVGARSVFAADIDRDGSPDVLSASETDNTIAWHENVAGNGSSWTSRVITTAAVGATSVFAADVDGDGDLDALSASANDDTIAWYDNTAGNGSAWTPRTISTAADGATSVYAADVDGDGDLDALSASANDDKIAWYDNTAGNGSAWTERILSTTADGATSVYAADVDGDGDLDALSASATDDKIAWYENTTGTGTAWTPRTISTAADGATAIFAVDMDDDGDLDALSASANDDTIAWYDNTAGNGSAWTERTLSTTADGASSVSTADTDGDGDLEALSASANDNTIAWYPNKTIHRSATFPTQTVITISAIAPRAVFAADIDDDGDLDALSASVNDNKVAWYENTVGDGTVWAATVITNTADGARSVSAADINGDGKQDVLSASEFDHKIAWYENTAGDGSAWASRVIPTTALGAFVVLAADLDRDGNQDVISASRDDNRVTWHENVAGDGTAWVSRVITTTAMGVRSIFVIDLDQDGDPDVLSASRSDNKVAWYENTAGDGSAWTSHVISLSAVGAHAVSAADIDGDGDVDAFSGWYDGDTVAWHENTTGDGAVWAAHTITTTADGAIFVSAEDMDNDGDIDGVVASLDDNTFAWYENTAGNGSAWAKRVIITGFSARSVHVADVNQDGALDVLTVATSSNHVAWHPNQGGQFALTTTATAPARLVQGQTDDFLKIIASHKGRAGDTDMELASLALQFDENLGDPLSSDEANAIIENLYVYHDSNGSGGFDPGDTPVATLATLSLTSGRQVITFADADPNVQVALGAPKTYFIVVELKANAASQTPNRFRITHLTTGSSTSAAEDRAQDIPLLLEYAADVSTGIIPAIAQADLTISKTDTPDPVNTSATLTYTLSITNAGLHPATGVIVTDTLPVGVTFGSASGSGWNCIHNSGVVTCTRPNLAADGATSTITIVTTAPPDSGTIVNTATISSSATDEIPANNTDTEDTVVRPVADLAVSKTDNPDPVAAGGTLTYTISVTNAGPNTAPSVTVTDFLPAGAVFNSASGIGWNCGYTAASHSVTCTQTSLSVGAGPTITILVTAPLTNGLITDSVTISSGASDLNPSNNSDTESTTVLAVNYRVYLPLVIR